MNSKRRALCVAGALLPLAPRLAHAQKHTGVADDGSLRLRGQVGRADKAVLELSTASGQAAQLALSEATTVFSLSKASFSDIDFGLYVGSVSEKLGDNIYSPIVRDSLSWLHRSYELRILDDSLRGLALGHQPWDRTRTSVMTHGWVDDMEDRVISIKYGPTDEEETDVELGRDIPFLRMARGSIGALQPGQRIFAGAQRAGGGKLVATFIVAGKEGIVPPL